MIKKVNEFPSYEVTDMGEVLRNGKILKQKSRNGRVPILILQENGKKRITTVSRLIAEGFMPNPDKCKYVIHLDGNVMNNAVNNLKWSNAKPSRLGKIKCNDQIYNSIKEASDALGLKVWVIRDALNKGSIKNGLSFTYVNNKNKKIEKDITIPDLPNEIWKPLRLTNGQYLISNMGRVKSISRQISHLRKEKLVVASISEGKATIKSRTYDETGKSIRRYFTVINEVMRHFGAIDMNDRTISLYNIDGDLNNCALTNIGVRKRK